MRSGKPRFVTGTPGCSGPRSKDPSPQLSSECEICVVGSCFFAIFRRLALHLQPRAEPTPVETVAPPSTCALRKCEARQPATKGTARGLFAKRGRRLRSKRRERLFRPGSSPPPHSIPCSDGRREGPFGNKRAGTRHLILNSRSSSLFWSLFLMSSRLSKSFFPLAMPSSHFIMPLLR